MTRGMWYGRVVPMAGIVYVIVVLIWHGPTAAAVGAMVLALVVLAGGLIARPQVDADSPRDRRRAERHSLRK